MPEGLTLKRIIDMDETQQLSSSDYVLVDSQTGGNKKFALGEELTSLKEDLTQEQTGFILCENGTFADEDGTTKYAINTRIRNAVPLSVSGVYSLTIPNGYQAWVFRLNKSGTLISAYGSWVSGKVLISSIATNDTKYINIAIKNTSTPSSDISSQVETVSSGLLLAYDTDEQISVLSGEIIGNALSLSSYYDTAFNIVDSVTFHSGHYWNNQLIVSDSATWGCYSPIALKAGTYAISNYQAVFSFVKNIGTGEVSGISNYISNGLLSVAFDFQLYLSNNSATSITVLNVKRTNRYVEVGEFSEFKTITEAINATSNWDTIFVHSGIYTEQLELWTKPRHLIGESRETTFIVDHSGAYATPPIEMSEGSLSNFTVIEDGSEAEQDANMQAYCLHIEWTPTKANSGLYVNNCTFINKIHSPLGCGLYQDYTVKFENCSFYCEAQNEGNMERGSFYFHSNVGEDVTGQEIIAENCIIKSADNYAVYIGTPYTANGGECRYRFSGCTIWSDKRGIADNCVFIQTDSDTTITKMIDSYGNTVAKLNSTQPHTPEN